jgi:hypothetical protein
MFVLSDQVRDDASAVQRRILFYIHFSHILMRTEFEVRDRQMSARW